MTLTYGEYWTKCGNFRWAEPLQNTFAKEGTGTYRLNGFKQNDNKKIPFSKTENGS